MKVNFHQWVLFPILSLLSVAYGIVIRIRIWLYAQKWLKSSQLPCPVWSVGNVTVGGTGKTPTTLWIAQQLINQGLRVGVLSRGYRRSSRVRFLLVSDGHTLLATPSDAGDEPYLIAKRCPGLVVACGADRYKLGKWVLERAPIDCFVLDDGFQHLKLYRDLDLVLLDSSESLCPQRLLPAGRLREPLNGVSRATALMVTRCDSGQYEGASFGILGNTKNYAMNLVTSRFTVEGLVQAGIDGVLPTSHIQGQSVLIFSGVAMPSSFRRTAESLGVKVVEEVVFPDHYVYTPADLERLVEKGTKSQAQGFLTTEKDLVKINEAWSFPQPLLAVRISLQVLQGVAILESCIQQMASLCHQK